VGSRLFFPPPLPPLPALAGYGVAFFFLSLDLRVVPTGIAYAIGSGVVIALISGINWICLKQPLDAPAVTGLALIVPGVAVTNLFSRTAGHGGRHSHPP
jgi:small multidrug resistance pump